MGDYPILLISQSPISNLFFISYNGDMGRTGYFDWHKVEQLPWPADWAALFGRAAPLVVEIGFGSGLFLVDLARRRPEANVLGLEISLPSLRNAGRKVRGAGLGNVQLMQADASSALQALCEPGSMAAVIINFPDPWPKKDQLGRRLIQDEFLALLASRMCLGADIDIATDHDEYAAHIADCLQRTSYFDSRAGQSFLLVDPDRVTTKYEQVARQAGRTPRYFKWRRNDTPAPDRFPIPTELPMPHVVLRLPADTAEIARCFQPAVIEEGGTRVRYIELYQSAHDGKLLIETYVNEGPIKQRLGLELQPRASGELVVSLAEMGFPRPTPGVHLAIRHLVARLREQFPALIVVHTTLQGDYADRPHE